MKILGHIVSPNGVQPDPEKVKAILNIPSPMNQKDVKKFMGAASHLKRKPNFTGVAKKNRALKH